MSTSTKDLLNTVANHDEVVKHYSTVTRLIHYTSKFVNGDDGKSSRNPAGSRRFRLAPLWPEWNDADVNAESWDVGVTRRKEATGTKIRTDPKIATQSSSHLFDDPDGKIELPSCFKIDHWKRPSDFIHSDKPIVVVDSEFGVHSFDLIASNSHLHQSEIFRHIISQINALWDICRRERKTCETFERTWRPWEHIYALNKVTKSPFIPSYNAAGKYVVRLYFLGSWRKIIIDDTIPFDDKNRCLLPQTTLHHELWPMLLTKALLKIIFLEFNASSPTIEYNETTVLHSLTGWIPEPIPLKYGHAEKIWNFLRYDRSNKLTSENPLQNSISFGPIPLFQWAENKIDENQSNFERDSQNLSEEKSSKKIASATNSNVAKINAPIKPQLSREKKSNVNQSTVVNPSTTVLSSVSKTKETRKNLALVRTNSADDGSSVNDESNLPDAPKLIVFGTISSLQPDRFSSFSEKADRSERLRQYNINETFSTSMLLTKIRDIPLEPPPAPPEPLPAWKLIRPRKPLVIPSAEPIAREKSKSDRWIEITSPYINYPTASALNISPTTRAASIESQITFVNPPFPGVIPPSTRSRTPISQIKTTNIIEVDEDDESKSRKLKSRLNSDAPRSNTSLDLNTPRRELSDVQSKVDESFSAGQTKLKREMSIDKNKMNPRASIFLPRMPSDLGSVRSKAGENSTVKMSKPIYVAPKIWMNFDDFCACFTSIIVFHNPRGYQHSHKFTDVKFVPYQQPIVVPPSKEKKKDPNQNNVQILPNLQEDKSILYLFVDTTRETIEKNIELIVSLSCLSRWFDSTINENLLSIVHEKSGRGSSVASEKSSVDANLSKTIVSQKDVLPQAGLLICEVCSWKSLSLGQPILRLHTTSTKAAPIVLKPGRHVLKFINTCPLAFHLHVMSDTHDFTLGDEEQLLNKIASVPEDRDLIDRAEELFLALDQSVENFHRIPPEENALTKLFHSFCEKSSSSNEITLEKCQNAFHQSLYPTIRTMMINAGTTANIDIQYAWRCFTNDRQTPDILHCYRGRRSSLTVASRHSARSATISSSNPAGLSTPAKRTLVNRDRSLDEKNVPRHQTVSVLSTTISEVPNESSSQWTSDKIEELKNIQRIARGFLQRRVQLARTVGTEKNSIIQRSLQNTMSILKNDPLQSSLLLFRSFISNYPSLIQCFPFGNDDWNMVTYHDYHGIYQEPAANNWFIIFRDVFYVHDDCFLAAKFLSHLPNSLLRIINNDNYTEMPLVFNRVAPGVLTQNKFGYTFVAQGVSTEPSPTQNRYRLRLLTAYVDLPEPRADPLISSFYTREFIDYYLPNKDEIICRFRVRIGSDLQLTTGRSFHLTSIQFVASNSNVLFRLSIFDQNDEILGVDGKGTAVLPAVLFFSGAKNSSTSNVVSRPSSNRTGSSGRKREGSTTRRGSGSDSQEKSSTRSSSGKKSRSTSRTESFVFDDEEKLHKYVIQVKLLRQSWPLNSNQIQFAEQIKEQEKNEFRVFNRQISTAKSDETLGEKRSTQLHAGRSSPTVKTRGNLNNIGTGRVGTPSSRPSTGKSSIDMTKPHWTLRVVSDADKVDEITVKKDNERNEELMNMKKAWETVEAGRAQKAFENRQKFLEVLQTENETNVENVLQPFLKPKFVDGQAKTIDSIFEQEEFERRQIQFMNFAEFHDALREKRREDFQNRYEEKLRQLSEYIELQGKVDETRRSMFEPREAFRQRFLEIERKRLAELAAEEQKLLDEDKWKAQTMKSIGNKRKASGKKTKKNVV